MHEKKIAEAIQIVWEYHQLHMKLPEEVDVMVVLGSADDTVARYAASVAAKVRTKAVIITGSSAHHGELAGRLGWEEPSEAEHFAAVMRMHGYTGPLLLETEARNTGQNAVLTAILLEAQSMKPKDLLIVTKPYMERRALRTFEKQWPMQTVFYVTSVGGTFDQYTKTSQSYEHTVKSMTGDLERIISYPALGFMTESEVPEAVERSLAVLQQAGFTRRRE